MTTTFTLLLFAFSVILLIKGADWLVEGASDIAQRLGVSDLAIGLTVVSFGTSMPELLVNVIASLNSSADIAIGNILGSNISNTLLILGATAIIAPLTIQRSTVLKEIPFCLLASCVLYVMANDAMVNRYPLSELSRGDGIVFIGFFLIFLYYTFGMSNNGKDKEHTKPSMSVPRAWLMVIGGLIGLSLGGGIAVDTAQTIALNLGISEALVGLTAVAIGTSLPELTASVMAALKGKSDIAIGNIVGSNIFNIFWILGISATIKPLTFQPAQNFDLLVVVFSALLLFFLVQNGHIHYRVLMWWRKQQEFILKRWEGGVLLASYVAYIAYISWRG
ncbi:MAG: calcium/sodium antiporter [bacterium]|nr:calcium/sodium antiporter [bacterium]